MIVAFLNIGRKRAIIVSGNMLFDTIKDLLDPKIALIVALFLTIGRKKAIIVSENILFDTTIYWTLRLH